MPVARLSIFDPKVFENLKTMFADKAASVFLGEIWFISLKGTLLSAIAMRPDTAESIELRDWPLVVGLYFVMVAITVCMERRIASRFPHGSFAATLLTSSLMLAPAWGFKSIIDIGFCSLMRDAYVYNVALCCVLLLGSTMLSFVLPSKSPDQNICLEAFAQIGASLNLGIGFAFNDVFRLGAGDAWGSAAFQNLYAPPVFFLIAKLNPLFAQTLQLAKRPSAKKLLSFAISTGTFIAAWALQALLKATYAGLFSNVAAVWRSFAWATFLSCLATIVGVNAGAGEVWSLLVSVSGINVGWAWMGLAKAVVHAVCDGSAWWAYILEVWAITLVSTLAAPLAAWSCVRLLNAVQARVHAQPKADEDEDSESHGSESGSESSA